MGETKLAEGAKKGETKKDGVIEHLSKKGNRLTEAEVGKVIGKFAGEGRQVPAALLAKAGLRGQAGKAPKKA